MKNISGNSGQLNPELLIFVFSFLQMIKALYLWGKKRNGKPRSDLPKTRLQLPQKRIKVEVLRQFLQIRSQAWQVIRLDFEDEIELHK